MVAQVLAGQTQQQEGSAGQGAQGEAQSHLAHDGSLRNSKSRAAHSGNGAGDNGHNTIVVRIGVKQQAQRHAEDADDGSDHGAQRAGDHGDQSVGHGSQHAGVLHNAGEGASGEHDGDHQESGLSMAVDDAVLQADVGIVDDQQDAVTDHEGDSGAEPALDQDDQDNNDQSDVEVPMPAGADQVAVVGGGAGLSQAGDLLGGDACSDALGFLLAQDDGNANAGDKADDPRGHDGDPQLTS